MDKDNNPFLFRQFCIPIRMRDFLFRYVEYGIPPGGFLTAVLENNLSEACGRADDENLENLPAYANYLYNHVPTNAWGSPQKVSEWIGLGGLRGKVETA